MVVVAVVAVLVFAGVLLAVLSGGRKVQVDGKDNGGVVTLRVGDTLVLTLESNATTGYLWDQVEFNKTILEQVSYDYKIRNHLPGMVGVGGWEIWEFRARSVGTTTLDLGYVRPWEKDAEPTRTFSVKVVVQ